MYVFMNPAGHKPYLGSWGFHFRLDLFGKCTYSKHHMGNRIPREFWI